MTAADIAWWNFLVLVATLGVLTATFAAITWYSLETRWLRQETTRRHGAGGWKTELMMRRHAAVTDRTLRAAEAVRGEKRANGRFSATPCQEGNDCALTYCLSSRI